MDIVVGSGPSGVAVALALLDRGRQVTMIDGGARLDSKAGGRQSEFAKTHPDDWTPQQIADWQTPQFSAEPGTARRFGSDHAQVPASQTFAHPPKWFGLRASHAVGGLSNVWGAAVLPNRQADMADWPITADDLAEHYKAISKVMEVSGRSDGLERLFPAFPMQGRMALQPGPQGRVLLQRLDRISAALAHEGVHVGQARHAVASDCKYCGMCLHGCPWGKIFSAEHMIAQFRERANFTYLPGRVVDGFSETAKSVKAHLKDGTALDADRLYLAAGVLETARIVLASHTDQSRSLMLRDSQHFFLPLLHRWQADGSPEHAPHHTLAEAFIEIDDPAISPFLTHTQIYGWNEFYAREMIARYAKKLPGSAPLFRALSRRLMVAQTFLHSDHSPSVALTLGPGDAMLSVSQVDNPATLEIMAATKRRLAKILARAGLFALKFAGSAGTVGSSFHSGSTLPMSLAPGGLQTDPTGRLHGLSRVHVVDASVLPSIPATTITLTVMANAHRIGSIS